MNRLQHLLRQNRHPSHKNPAQSSSRASYFFPCAAAPMVTRWSEKGPGLKILWIWTLGTAAIMITNVFRTQLNDMEKIPREEVGTSASAAAAPTGRARPERR